MRKFIQAIIDRVNRNNRYDKKEYWDMRAVVCSGLARSWWLNNNYNKYFDITQKNILKSYLQPISGSKILDVGCGIGRITLFLGELAADIIGVDIGQKVIESAKKELGGKKDNVNLEVMSVFDLKFEDQKFDVVLSIGCLAFACADDEKFNIAIREILRVTRNGGKILLMEPFHKTWLIRRLCSKGVKDWINTVQENGAILVEQMGMCFIPFRFLLTLFPIPKIFTKPLFYLGESLLKLSFLSPLSDYKILLFRK